MRMSRLSSVTVLATVLLAGEARADDWTSLGLDGPRSRLTGERSGPMFGPEHWEQAIPPVKDAMFRVLMSSPAVADGYLVHGTVQNTVRGLREADGALLWQFRTRDAILSSPAVWRGWVYVADTARQLYALRLADGALVWKRQVDGAVQGSPVVVDGSLLLVTNAPQPRVLKLDALTGAVQWRAGEGWVEQDLNAGVAVAEGRVIVGETTGLYHSFDLATGAHQWTARTGGIVHMSSPVVINGRVYLLPGGELNELHALEIDTGKPVKGWPVSLPAPAPVQGSRRREYVFSSVAGAGDRLFFDRRVEDRVDRSGDGAVDTLVFDEAVLAVDAAEGKVLWSRPNGRRDTDDLNGGPTYGLCPTPALYRGSSSETLLAVASSLSPRLRVLDPAGGDERWSAELSGPTRGSPLLANGRLVIGTDAGVIHSFLSRTNAPPAQPLALSPVGGVDADASAVTLRWMGGLDSEDGAVSYEVRLDDDGEVLHDWELAVATTAGQQTLALAAPLAPGRTYTFAVRGRDSKGALSAWSAPGQLPRGGSPVGAARRGAGDQPDGGAGPGPRWQRDHAGRRDLPAVEHAALAGRGVPGRRRAAPDRPVRARGWRWRSQAGAGNGLRQLTVAGAVIGVDVTSGEDAHLRERDPARQQRRRPAGEHRRGRRAGQRHRRPQRRRRAGARAGPSCATPSSPATTWAWTPRAPR